MAANRTRGHRAGLTKPAILSAAVRLADEEGLDRLSMRRLASELGVEAMTLYHHFPNKNALLDGIVEHIVAHAAPAAGGTSWRERLRGYAQTLRATLTAHPNVVPLFLTRQAMTPHNLQAMEDMMGALGDAGFSPSRALDVIYALTGFVLGDTVLQAGPATPQAAPSNQLAALATVDPGTYPLLTQAARSGESPGPTRFEFALDALIAGIHPG